MPRPGSSKTQVASEELRTVLEGVLARTPGAGRRITGLDRHPAPYGSSYTIEELSVLLTNGTTLELIFKDLGREALLETARRIKPSFLYNPLREIETYLRVLAADGRGTAACYGAVIDPGIGRYWLFLEKVRGSRLSEIGDLAAWQQVARWQAAMHARYVGETETLARAAPLLRYDRSFYKLWMDRALRFSRGVEPSQPQASRGHIDRLARRYGRVMEHLLGLTATFIHGEFYASNVLVGRVGRPTRVCPVDWEMAAIGPGLVDLAALVAGRWTAPERTALAMAYFTESMTHGASWQDAEPFLSSLDYCRLHLAVQWLGWSPSWTPPPEHAQDWLHEALDLAEKLELV